MAENGETENMSNVEKKIWQQIEYYFGDHNLPQDKFLQEQIKLDDGWVPLETIVKFNRLSLLTTDIDVVVGALKKSKTELVEVNADKTKIRRSPNKPPPEVTEQYKNAMKSRSVYIKGFPEDTTLDDLKEWIDCKGKVESIQMRRTLEKTFKGSIFVVFDSVETAKAFIKTPKQKYNDKELIVLSRDDYTLKKIEEKRRNRLEAKAKAKLAKKERQKQAEDAEMKNLEEKHGWLLKFSGDLEDETCREDLHEVFSDHGEIKWIDFSRGAKQGIILFKSSAKEVLEKAKKANNENLQLRGKDVTWVVLEGEDAREALRKIMEGQQKTFNRNKVKVHKGKGKGGKKTQGAQDKKVKFQGKKTKFESEDEDEGKDNDSKGPPSLKKRPLEDPEREEPVPKQLKTENGAGDKK